MEPSLGLTGGHLFVFLGAGNGGGAQLYAQDQSKIMTRSYSDSIVSQNQTSSHSFTYWCTPQSLNSIFEYFIDSKAVLHERNLTD